MANGSGAIGGAGWPRYKVIISAQNVDRQNAIQVLLDKSSAEAWMVHELRLDRFRVCSVYERTQEGLKWFGATLMDVNAIGEIDSMAW